MKKGIADLAVILVLAIVLLLISVGIFFAGLRNITEPTTPRENTVSAECRSNLDCANRENGNECLQIFELEGNQPFCGCRFTNNCTGGKVCGSDFKCE